MDSRKLVLLNRDQFKEDYLKLNPKAQVPTLVHNGIPIRRSSVICDYIDNLKPEIPLKPEDLADIAHMREWIRTQTDLGIKQPPLSILSQNLD